jgi:hypothetical protein
VLINETTHEDGLSRDVDVVGFAFDTRLNQRESILHKGPYHAIELDCDAEWRQAQ